MIDRIGKRGRSYEQVANDPSLYDYYKLLNERYDAWYENFDVCPKMQIDGDELDFVADPQNLNKIMKNDRNKASRDTYRKRERKLSNPAGCCKKAISQKSDCSIESSLHKGKIKSKRVPVFKKHAKIISILNGCHC